LLTVVGAILLVLQATDVIQHSSWPRVVCKIWIPALHAVIVFVIICCIYGIKHARTLRNLLEAWCLLLWSLTCSFLCIGLVYPGYALFVLVQYILIGYFGVVPYILQPAKDRLLVERIRSVAEQLAKGEGN
jgi:hypothetical protein